MILLSLAPAQARADYQIIACGIHPNHIFHASSAYGMGYADGCPSVSGTSAPGSLELYASFTQSFSQGQGAIWQASAPAGLTITDVGIKTGNVFAAGINQSGSPFGGDFYWQGGNSNISGNSSFFGPTVMSSSYFGFLLVCAQATCTGKDANMEISNIEMTIHESAAPSFNATGLWQAPGWVRGTWPLSVSSDSPAGVCLLAATLDGTSVGETTSVSDPTVWHQCNAGAISTSVDTSRFGEGAVPFTLLAADASAIHSAPARTLDIDNERPSVTLSGPADVPTSAGTQYVTANASAGPSGVAGIGCALDGGPEQYFSGTTAQVAVSGVGEHAVQCYASNNAADANGVQGTSPMESFSMRIGEPTVAAVAFSKVVNRLRCRRVTEVVHIPARWVRVRVHGRLVRVHEKAHRQRIKVTRCHARTVRRRVTRVVTIRRHGKTIHVRRREIVRVVLHPRSVLSSRERVGHGKPATVFGWLGTDQGIALGGQTVDVLTAPDNGGNRYHVAAVTTTAPNGAWSAPVPAGPSRLISASYAGSATTESAFALPVHLTVPAKVELLSVSPRNVPWGGVVNLAGRLKGGYLPRGGALVRLRIGQGSAVTTYGIREHVRGDGRFRTTYHFGEGEAAVHRSFWFQIASLPMGNYPYAPAASRRLPVTVGGHPAAR